MREDFSGAQADTGDSGHWAFQGGMQKAGFWSPLPHRVHLMAGRVPQGAERAAVQGEMETVFLENLRYAAEVLAQVRQVDTHVEQVHVGGSS